MLSQHPKAIYQKQPLRVPEERNVRPCEELALPQPPKFGFRSQEDEQTSCTTSRLTLVLSMRERARLVWMRFIRLRVKICQLLRNTTFRGHNSMIRSRPDPLRAFTGSGCGYTRLRQYITSHDLSPRSRVHGWSREPFTREELLKFISLIIVMGLVNLPTLEDHWMTTWPYSSQTCTKAIIERVYRHILAMYVQCSWHVTCYMP